MESRVRVCAVGRELYTRDENALCVYCVDVHVLSERRDIGRSVYIECVGY